MGNVASILDSLPDDERAEIEAAIAAPTPKAPRALSMRVSKKGCMSVYGVHTRFPVTLYANQWARLLDFADNIRDFLASEPTHTHEIDGVATEVSLSLRKS